MERKYQFTNAIMFSLVMRDPSLCKELLEVIFPDRKIREVRLHEDFVEETEDMATVEKTILVGMESRSVRLDVLFTDSLAWYDVEMQVRDEHDLPKRSRYAHAVCDVDTLKRGETFDRLKPGYVIFLCCFDFFGEDRPMYQFSMHEDKTGRSLGDETYTVILNSRASGRGTNPVPAGLAALFRYMNEAVVDEDSALIRRIDRGVERWNGGEGRRVIMTLEQEMLRKEARARDERDQQMRALYRIMKQDGRLDEYDALMESDDKSILNALLEEYGLADKGEPAFG